MWSQRLIGLAWPAFIAACVLELVVFAFVDPMEFHWGAAPLGWSRQGVYTAAFFVFWGVTLAACALTSLLQLSPAEVNRCPFAPGERPDGCPAR